MLVTGGYSKNVIVQDPKVETPSKIHSLEIDSQINCVRVKQKNPSHMIAVGGNRNFLLLDNNSGNIICKKQKNVGNICSLNFLQENLLQTAEQTGQVNFQDIRNCTESLKSVRAFNERINTSCIQKSSDNSRNLGLWCTNPKAEFNFISLKDDLLEAQVEKKLDMRRFIGESQAMRQSRQNQLIVGDTKGYISLIKDQIDSRHNFNQIDKEADRCQKFHVHDGFIFKLKNIQNKEYDNEILISSGQDCSVNIQKLNKDLIDGNKDNQKFNLERTKSIKTRKICQDMQIINNYVFVACSDNFIQLYDTNSRDTQHKFKYEGHSKAVTTVCYYSN